MHLYSNSTFYVGCLHVKKGLVHPSDDMASYAKLSEEILQNLLNNLTPNSEQFPHLYWVFSEHGLCTLTTTKTCWNCDLRLGMKGRAPGSYKMKLI